MKVFVATIVLAVIALSQALTPEQIEKLKTIHAQCAAESGVNPELVTKARQGEFTDDPKLKSHLFCFSKKVGFQDAGGALQLDVIKTKVNGELNDQKATDELIAKCGIQKATPEDTVYDAVKCVYENTPKRISLA